MNSTSFTRKIIETRITLAQGAFGGQGLTKVLRGLATELHVEKPGFPDKAKATVRISNVPLSDMEQMTTLAFKPLQYQRNAISVYAGDEESGLSLVFCGEITSAHGDFNAAPDPVFAVQAMSGFFGALTPSAPTSVPGSVGVAHIVQQMAGRLGYSFINEGFTGQIKNAVLCGSPLEQAQAAAKQAGAELIMDDSTLILCPPGQPRGNGNRVGQAVLLSKDSGLIGYPTFTNNGISLRCLYNPALQFGACMEVHSIVPKASGLWRITKLSHKLSAHHSSGGHWHSTVEGTLL